MLSVRRLRVPLVLLAVLAAGGATAQQPVTYASSGEARAAYNRAIAQQKEAARRGAQLEKQAAAAREAVDRTAREAAALAARIQQSEATLTAAEARYAVADTLRKKEEAQLAARQRPLVELTAALQNLSRRPLALSVFRPGSVREMVYLRAALSATLPEVSRRTAALRSEIARLEALRLETQAAIAAQRKAQAELGQRRQRLAVLETRQRLEARKRGNIASRETDRALALAEEARDIDALMANLDAEGSLRKELAALPGPILRPPRPEQAEVVGAAEPEADERAAPPEDYRLPLAGRTVAGFGAVTQGGQTSQGITIVPRPGAQAVAPAAGRVAFAGIYRGYGRIVIIEHEGGWTSLVTGLGRVDVDVGEELVAGAPLGIAGVRSRSVTLELRNGADPVNPLDYVS